MEALGDQDCNREGGEALSSILAELVEKVRAPELSGESHSAPPRLVLPIDQGEELFLADAGEEADAFLRLLKELVAAEDSNLIVLVTIRSDAYERLQTAPTLEGVSQQTYSLPPLPRGAYQTVIEGPAERLKETRRPLKIEPALTAALLADVEAGGAKDALPLLASRSNACIWSMGATATSSSPNTGRSVASGARSRPR